VIEEPGDKDCKGIKQSSRSSKHVDGRYHRATG
jgi:hypothetical protein